MFVYELGIYEDWLYREKKQKPEFTRQIVAETAGKAKYQYYRDLSDIYDWEFGDFVKWVYCKKIGIASIRDFFGDKEMFEHVKQLRNMPFIYQGMQIEVCGKPGVIVGAGSGANLHVVFDGQYRDRTCHPWYETVYYDQAGNIVADYRKKKAVG